MMSNVIRVRRTDTAGKVPTVEQLEFGEFAVNTTDGKVYLKFDYGQGPEIVEVGVASLMQTVSAMQQSFEQLRQEFDEYKSSHP